MARVLLFGALSDLAGWRERAVEAGSVFTLRDRLAAEDPTLGEALRRPGVQVALEKMVVRHDAELSGASEVAFLPPMSGG